MNLFPEDKVINVLNSKDFTMAQQTITLGGGCFWCVEAIFKDVQGVTEVTSGYSGGTEETANYRAVCSKETDHVEVVQVSFDDAVISLEDILKIFFSTHNPTTPNQQGADKGPQYRSVIFYHNEEQREVAERVARDFAPTLWDDPIVTGIEPFDSYYLAENYHQDYYAKTGNRNPYCTVVITPKVSKFRKQFAERLKPGVV